MRITGGKELGFEGLVRFNNKDDYVVAIYDDVTDLTYGKGIVAYCLESNIEGIKAEQKIVIPVTAQLQHHVNKIAESKVFSIHYQGKRRSKNGRQYHYFKVSIYTVKQAIMAYPELSQFIKDVTEVPF